jgi:transcriptional regulator with XRE-family HTH domain
MEWNIQLDWKALVREAIKRRKENKLSQKHLAAIAGVNHLGVIKFEKMQENIELKTIFAILRVLGLLKGN